MDRVKTELVELLRWLARRRSPVELRDERGSRLVEILGLDAGDPQNVQAAIDQLIRRMDAGPHRSAAEALLGSGPLRWEALKSRQHEAAKGFGVKIDAFRRKRSGGKESRENEVLAELAHVIAIEHPDLSTHPESNGAHEHQYVEHQDLESDGPDPEEPAGSDTSSKPSRISRTTVASVGGVAIVALVLVTAVAVLAGGDDNSDQALFPLNAGGCQYSLGQDADSESAVAELIAEYEAGGGAEAYECPLTAVQRLPNSPLIYQEFGKLGHTPNQVVVAFDEGGALTLPFAAWGSYHQIGGRSGDSAHSIAGDPLGLRVTPSAAYLELDSDVQLVAETAEAPYFFVVAPSGAAWDERGGPAGEMGLPTSNLHVQEGEWRQEFENGWLAAENADGVVTWHPVESPRDHLPPDEVIAGRIIGQLDGTGWLVTTDLKRKWIPDGLVWNCLGGSAEQVSADTPGYAIAQLPYGGIATCADSRLGSMNLAAYCLDNHGPGFGPEVSEVSSDEWQCVSGDGTRESVELEAVCEFEYGDERLVVSLELGDPTAWKCASPDWEPLVS